MRRPLLCVLTILTGLFAAPTFLSGAHAQSAYEAAVSGFAADSFLDTDKAIGAVAATGDPMALPVLQALKDGRLFFTADPKGLYIRDDAGAVTDAVTGKPVDPAPDDLKTVRLNNRVRGTLAAALGSMTLLASDPAQRLSAAHEVFRSRDTTALPALATALAKEQDPEVKAALVDAQAAIIATKSDAPEKDRLDAIGTLRARGGQEALSLLTNVAQASDGVVKAAAESGVSSIQTRLMIWSNLQNVWYGMSLGSVLLLAAIGLAITFGVMGVINMAHGEMVMIGAYTTFVVQEVIRAYAPGLFNMSLFIAIPLAFLVTAAAGVIVERTIIRFLYGRPLETLLATFGLSLILQQLVRTLFGADNRDVGAPAFMSGTFDVGGLAITYGRMWIIVFALMVFAAIQMLLRMTSFGLKMRAVTQNRRMASAMGIDTNRVDALAFGLGSGIAGIAGVALSQIDNVSPNLGQGYIIDSFMVVVFGGVGNLWGTLVAALTLGIANKFLEPFAGAVLGKIALLVFIILFIQKRPRGLFAQKGRAVEA